MPDSVLMTSATRIDRVHAREVFDSRGRPTVEVEVTCAGGRTGTAIVPSGASTGQHEAHELRDGDPARLGGAGVRRAVANVSGIIARELLGFDAADQVAVDQRLCTLDGTSTKSRLGANAILGVSLAAAHAAAVAKSVALVEHLHGLWIASLPAAYQAAPPTLPLPMVNMISGGLHAGKNLDFQDFLAIPVGAASFRQALDWIVTIYHQLGRLLRQSGYEGTLVGDEGGYGPKLSGNRQAVEIILDAITASGLQPGRDVALGLDVASTHFFEQGRYRLSAADGGPRDSAGMVELLADWTRDYPIISIEDGLADDDWEGWQALTGRLGRQVQLIGDDLFVTSSERLARGIRSGVANSALIKLNQIGTLTETLTALALAQQAGYWTVVSARSGETEDTTIADLAVATSAGQIKIGSVARSERLAKYNQLLRLEERLGPSVPYAGGSIFSSLNQ